MREKLEFTIPLVPPSVNMYVRHVCKGRFAVHYVTPQAKSFWEAVAICSRRQKVGDDKSEFDIIITVYLGKGQKLDWDNIPKCVGDGLTKAGVIHSDAAIMQGLVRKRRDRKNPRTEVIVRVLP